MRRLVLLLFPLWVHSQVLVNPFMSFGGGAAGNGLLSPCLSYYKMDEASGTINDSKGTRNSTSQTNLTYSATGKLNTGIQIAATTGNGIGFGDVNTFDLTTGSISCWVFITGGAYVMSNMNDNTDRNGWALLRNGTTWGFQLGSASAIQTASSVSTITLSSWYHIVVTWNGSQILFYLNGTLDATVSQTVTPAYSTEPFSLMTGNNGSSKVFPMAGTLDEVGIFNAVLTQTQVTTLYNSGTPLPFSSFN